MAPTAGTEAAEMVGAVRDDPDRRLGLAAGFYDTPPRRGSIRPYRREADRLARGRAGPPTSRSDCLC
ncbi:MAG: hypothetical protein QOJ93_551, partial [Actinomycetota bacterium]|nr:hypothetical protein [Actinomycetota bacterium]